jgi:hypothetical protein
VSIRRLSSGSNGRRVSPDEIVPENLLGSVTVLSDDISEHNPDCLDGLVDEFFKAYRYVGTADNPIRCHFLEG